MDYASRPGLSPILIVLLVCLLAALGVVGWLFVAMMGTILG